VSPEGLKVVTPIVLWELGYFTKMRVAVKPSYIVIVTTRGAYYDPMGI